MVTQATILLSGGEGGSLKMYPHHQAGLGHGVGRWGQESGLPTYCGNHCEQQGCSGKGPQPQHRVPVATEETNRPAKVFDEFIVFTSEGGGTLRLSQLRVITSPLLCFFTRSQKS